MPELPRTAALAAAALRRRDLSSLELTDAFLAAAAADPHNAWLRLEPERARAQARAAGI